MKAIGGYFEWEFPLKQRPFPHENGVLVNSGHGAIQLLLEHMRPISKVWLPYYTCDSVANALEDKNITYEFYHIDSRLELSEPFELKENEVLIYVNYFGIKDNYCRSLETRYKQQLILDNAQAFFTQASEVCHQIYSPRKYVGVSEGGIAVSPLSISADDLPPSSAADICQHLLIRQEGDISKGYTHFRENSSMLRNAPLSRMSPLTWRHLRSLDYAEIVEKRKRHFSFLHEKLASRNRFAELITQAIADNVACPMVYPFYTQDASLRARLIQHHVFVAQYWPNVLEWCSPCDREYHLCQNIIPLPIDQRYGQEDMERIVNLIVG